MIYIQKLLTWSRASSINTLIAINVGIWLVGIFLLQEVFSNSLIFHIFGLSFNKFYSQFWIWQIFTYFFIHASGVSHILFNMLALWMFGSELERLWGSRFFLIFYLCCGIGSGIIYLLCLFFGSYFFDLSHNLSIPMIGASGACFGILLAYGLIFKDKVVHFMMIFPIKAGVFVSLIAVIEFINLVNLKLGSSVSHLAHLSGLAIAFIFLKFWKAFPNWSIKSWKHKFISRLSLVKNTNKKNSWH